VAIITASTKDLFSSRPGGLAFGAFAARATGLFLNLVGAIEIRRVGRGVQPRANAKSVNGRSGPDQLLQCVLVNAPACKYAGLFQPAVVEGAPNLSRVLREVAAVQAHASDSPTASFDHSLLCTEGQSQADDRACDSTNRASRPHDSTLPLSPLTELEAKHAQSDEQHNQ